MPSRPRARYSGHIGPETSERNSTEVLFVGGCNGHKLVALRFEHPSLGTQQTVAIEAQIGSCGLSGESEFGPQFGGTTKRLCVEGQVLTRRLKQIVQSGNARSEFGAKEFTTKFLVSDLRNEHAATALDKPHEPDLSVAIGARLGKQSDDSSVQQDNHEKTGRWGRLASMLLSTSSHASKSSWVGSARGSTDGGRHDAKSTTFSEPGASSKYQGSCMGGTPSASWALSF